MSRRPESRSSALRDRLGETTRRIILDALVAELAERGPFELTYPALARRAGVSVRTIYRHFPTRVELLDGLSRLVSTTLAVHSRAQTRAEVVATVHHLFAMYDRHPSLIKAQILAGVGGTVRSRARARRVGVVHAVLAAQLPHLADDRRAAAAGLLTCLFSASVWQRLKEEAGLDGAQAGEITGWAMDTLWRALELEDRRAAG